MRVWLPLFAGPVLSVLVAASDPGQPRDPGAAERARIASLVRPASDFSAPEPHEALQAGAATSIEDPDADAFSHFSANLPEADVARFRRGNALFRKVWRPSSSAKNAGGLGPFFNAPACIACHIRDGRGHPPQNKAEATLLFLRLARPARSAEERQALADHLALAFPDPVYGRQLQDRAIDGLAPEGRMAIRYSEQRFVYPDGDRVLLRKPDYDVEDLRYGALDRQTTLSPRMAPAMIGLGLIEAISDADILARADADDRDHDGVSGHPQMLAPPGGGLRPGRFGWKGERASVRDQSAHAFLDDIGLSTPDLPTDSGDCTSVQKDCLGTPGGSQSVDGVEAADPILPLVTFYSQNLAVPARRKASFAETLAGKALFYRSGCINCHTPKYVTRRDWPEAHFRNQLIWPYSDFLLHDMGGGLADGQSVGAASAREWRTPPLWGVGLTGTVGAGKAFYLHDGRARTLEEAILWHYGEASGARDAFARLARQDRQTLIGFLNSL